MRSPVFFNRSPGLALPLIALDNTGAESVAPRADARVRDSHREPEEATLRGHLERAGTNTSRPRRQRQSAAAALAPSCSSTSIRPSGPRALRGLKMCSSPLHSDVWVVTPVSRGQDRHQLRVQHSWNFERAQHRSRCHPLRGLHLPRHRRASSVCANQSRVDEELARVGPNGRG